MFIAPPDMTPSALQPYKSNFNFRTPNGRYFHCLKIIKNLSKNSLKLAERVSNEYILYVHFFVNPNLGYLHKYTPFRKKRFEINFFVQGNASKFAIFIEKENIGSFFRFSFRAFLSFPL